MKIYSIVPINFTYNDEYNSEEGFDKPQFACKTRDAALAKMDELTIQQFKHFNPQDYYNDGLSTFCSRPDDVEIQLKLIFPEHDFSRNDLEYCFIDMPLKMTDIQAKAVSRIFNEMHFYEIVETELT